MLNVPRTYARFRPSGPSLEGISHMANDRAKALAQRSTPVPTWCFGVVPLLLLVVGTRSLALYIVSTRIPVGLFTRGFAVEAEKQRRVLPSTTYGNKTVRKRDEARACFSLLSRGYMMRGVWANRTYRRRDGKGCEGAKAPGGKCIFLWSP